MDMPLIFFDRIYIGIYVKINVTFEEVMYDSCYGKKDAT